MAMIGNGWFKPRLYCDVSFIDVRHPNLDSKITIQEMSQVIRNFKNWKTAGRDGIKNEHLKLLTKNWPFYLLKLFNSYLENENPSNELKNITLTLLHKKENRNDKNNYRGIALVNIIVKLLTFIINNRLQTWVESYDIFS